MAGPVFKEATFIVGRGVTHHRTVGGPNTRCYTCLDGSKVLDTGSDEQPVRCRSESNRFARLSGRHLQHLGWEFGDEELKASVPVKPAHERREVDKG